MRIRTLLRKWKSKFGFAGAAGVTLWILSTYPPDRPVWRYIAWKGVLPGAWLSAVLIWAWPRAKRRLLILGGLIVMSATWAVAFVFFFPTLEPLEVKTFHIPAKYLAGSVIGGIPWEEFYSDVRVQIKNPSDNDYTNVDVLINASDAIDRVGQISKVACVELLSASDPLQRPRTVGLTTAGGDVIPAQEQRFSRDGFRLRCATFPRNSTIEIILATVNLNPNPISRGLFGPKRPPAEITVEGRYTTDDVEHTALLTRRPNASYWKLAITPPPIEAK